MGLVNSRSKDAQTRHNNNEQACEGGSHDVSSNKHDNSAASSDMAQQPCSEDEVYLIPCPQDEPNNHPAAESQLAAAAAAAAAAASLPHAVVAVESIEPQHDPVKQHLIVSAPMRGSFPTMEASAVNGEAMSPSCTPRAPCTPAAAAAAGPASAVATAVHPSAVAAAATHSPPSAAAAAGSSSAAAAAAETLTTPAVEAEINLGEVSAATAHEVTIDSLMDQQASNNIIRPPLPSAPSAPTMLQIASPSTAVCVPTSPSVTSSCAAAASTIYGFHDSQQHHHYPLRRLRSFRNSSQLLTLIASPLIVAKVGREGGRSHALNKPSSSNDREDHHLQQQQQQGTLSDCTAGATPSAIQHHDSNGDCTAGATPSAMQHHDSNGELSAATCDSSTFYNSTDSGISELVGLLGAGTTSANRSTGAALESSEHAQTQVGGHTLGGLDGSLASAEMGAAAAAAAPAMPAAGCMSAVSSTPSIFGSVCGGQSAEELSGSLLATDDVGNTRLWREGSMASLVRGSSVPLGQEVESSSCKQDASDQNKGLLIRDGHTSSCADAKAACSVITEVAPAGWLLSSSHDPKALSTVLHPIVLHPPTITNWRVPAVQLPPDHVPYLLSFRPLQAELALTTAVFPPLAGGVGPHHHFCPSDLPYTHAKPRSRCPSSEFRDTAEVAHQGFRDTAEVAHQGGGMIGTTAKGGPVSNEEEGNLKLPPHGLEAGEVAAATESGNATMSANMVSSDEVPTPIFARYGVKMSPLDFSKDPPTLRSSSLPTSHMQPPPPPPPPSSALQSSTFPQPLHPDPDPDFSLQESYSAIVKPFYHSSGASLGFIVHFEGVTTEAGRKNMFMHQQMHWPALEPADPDSAYKQQLSATNCNTLDQAADMSHPALVAVPHQPRQLAAAAAAVQGILGRQSLPESMCHDQVATIRRVALPALQQLAQSSSAADGTLIASEVSTEAASKALHGHDVEVRNIQFMTDEVHGSTRCHNTDQDSSTQHACTASHTAPSSTTCQITDGVQSPCQNPCPSPCQSLSAFTAVVQSCGIDKPTRSLNRLPERESEALAGAQHVAETVALNALQDMDCKERGGSRHCHAVSCSHAKGDASVMHHTTRHHSSTHKKHHPRRKHGFWLHVPPPCLSSTLFVLPPHVVQHPHRQDMVLEGGGGEEVVRQLLHNSCKMACSLLKQVGHYASFMRRNQPTDECGGMVQVGGEANASEQADMSAAAVPSGDPTAMSAAEIAEALPREVLLAIKSCKALIFTQDSAPNSAVQLNMSSPPQTSPIQTSASSSQTCPAAPNTARNERSTAFMIVKTLSCTPASINLSTSYSDKLEPAATSILLPPQQFPFPWNMETPPTPNGSGTNNQSLGKHAECPSSQPAPIQDTEDERHQAWDSSSGQQRLAAEKECKQGDSIKACGPEASSLNGKGPRWSPLYFTYDVLWRAAGCSRQPITSASERSMNSKNYENKVLTMMLVHDSQTLSQLLLQPPSASGAHLQVHQLKVSLSPDPLPADALDNSPALVSEAYKHGLGDDVDQQLQQQQQQQQGLGCSRARHNAVKQDGCITAIMQNSPLEAGALHGVATPSLATTSFMSGVPGGGVPGGGVHGGGVHGGGGRAAVKGSGIERSVDSPHFPHFPHSPHSPQPSGPPGRVSRPPPISSQSFEGMSYIAMSNGVRVVAPTQEILTAEQQSKRSNVSALAMAAAAAAAPGAVTKSAAVGKPPIIPLTRSSGPLAAGCRRGSEVSSTLNLTIMIHRDKYSSSGALCGLLGCFQHHPEGSSVDHKSQSGSGGMGPHYPHYRRRRGGRLSAASSGFILPGTLPVLWRPAPNGMRHAQHGAWGMGHAQQDGDLLELPSQPGTIDQPQQHPLHSPSPQCRQISPQKRRPEVTLPSRISSTVRSYKPVMDYALPADKLTRLQEDSTGKTGSKPVQEVSAGAPISVDLNLCRDSTGTQGQCGVGIAGSEPMGRVKRELRQDNESKEFELSFNSQQHWISMLELDEEGVLQHELRHLYEVLLYAERLAS
ncbi:hypothetical protein CEUSTIGMA_g7408.t1 [Chlamydomonas eustigma]|uniref:Uncharacterized protein n=1 Tax=Chlamydomonas eustigma TaxID=1157962 RepID=A0A250XAP8_9CHLO|nr:hypothetical protein CEUSTIGMA_g7408.t1 [Chlamydomonas eustigma]|eukprot:GAX79969.1 hypothetical protein CEUSTIGMA_g7408.t1 [Chlamydomonas eustigma]